MDIERMKKLLKSGIEAGNKTKAVREVVKTYQTRKQDMYDDTAELFKPSTDVQEKVKKTIDEKQDKLIEKQDELIKQLKNNQEQIVKAIEWDPATTMYGRKLPEIKYDEDDEDYEDDEDFFGEDDKDVTQYDNIEQEEDEEEEDEPSTSEKKTEKKPIFNLDSGISEEYKRFLENKKFPLPSEIFKKGSNPDEFISKAGKAMKQNEDYISSHSTTKGQPYKSLNKKEKKHICAKKK